VPMARQCHGPSQAQLTNAGWRSHLCHPSGIKSALAPYVPSPNPELKGKPPFCVTGSKLNPHGLIL
jgi:hypothetical protein